MSRAVLSLVVLLGACEPVHRSLAYQRSLHVIATETVPGKGTYEVFIDWYDHCHVDFEAEPRAMQQLISPFIIVAPSSFPPAADLFREQELLRKHCPDRYTLAQYE